MFLEEKILIFDTELFAMRNLLLRMRAVKSFEELRTYNSIVYPTFKQAAVEQGSIDGDSEWRQTMNEAISFMMPSQLRTLFTTILSQCNTSNPELLWDNFKNEMSADDSRLIIRVL